MHGSQYWTALEEDRDKTAFTVQRGKFEFNVMPYGLCNAGATYQRMMDISLSGLPAERVLAYMHDILIFSDTFEEHLQSLEMVFQKLRESSISLKLSKFVFASRKVDFLGFELSKSGIRPQSRLTEAISNLFMTSQKLLNGCIA